jgi:hypothetical protein
MLQVKKTMTKKILMGLIALVLIAAFIGPVTAVNPAYPIKMVVIGETIPYGSAYNLDPYNIVPKDTFLICKINGDPQYSTCIGRDSNDPDGSKFRYFGAWLSQNPAPFGEYYAVPYSSLYVINNKTIDVQIIKNDPAFRNTHLKLYTVLPKPTPTPTPTPLPTATPTPTPTPSPTPDYAAMEAKIKAQETEIQNIKATLAQTTVPTLVPTPAIIPSPAASGQTFGDLVSPTPTPSPKVTVNYTKHLQEMETRIAAQDVKIEEQGNILDQILRFLGLKN